MKWGAFKPLLADAVVAHLEPIQQKYNEVRRGFVVCVLEVGRMAGHTAPMPSILPRRQVSHGPHK